MRLRRLAVLAALLVAGCGQEVAEAPDGVRLTVTERFGTERELVRPLVRVPDDATARDVVRRAGAVPAMLFVNGVGVDAREQARVRDGDQVWSDRNTAGADRVPAVVGAFPEPFVRGFRGERLPTRIECDEPSEPQCDRIAQTLAEYRVFPGRSRLGTGGGEESLRVLVGPWSALRTDRAGILIDLGPERSGVYARFSEDGRSLALLDARGRAVRTLGARTGLVAATRFDVTAPTWLVTGTDAAGVAAATRALREDVLRDRFAVAIVAGDPVALPVVGR